VITSNFDRVRVINLAERTDRRDDMIGEFKALGVWGDPKIAFHSATRAVAAAPWRSNGEHGCFLSHLEVIEEAAAAGESVLLLEDDCDFTSAAKGDLPRVDVLWGGYALHERHIEGAHCMGFSARAAKRLAPYLRALLDHPSPAPVDGAYILFCRDNPDLQVLACSPMLAVQRPSPSNIAGASAVGSSALLQPGVSIGRRVKRALKRRLNTRGQGQQAFDQLVDQLRT
jgi:glycosyl transferase family 25